MNDISASAVSLRIGNFTRCSTSSYSAMMSASYNGTNSCSSNSLTTLAVAASGLCVINADTPVHWYLSQRKSYRLFLFTSLFPCGTNLRIDFVQCHLWLLAGLRSLTLLHKQVKRTGLVQPCTPDGKRDAATSDDCLHKDVERRVGTHAKLLAEFIKLRLHLRVYSYCYCRLCHNSDLSFVYYDGIMPPIRRQKYKLIPKVPNNSASFYQI